MLCPCFHRVFVPLLDLLRLSSLLYWQRAQECRQTKETSRPLLSSKRVFSMAGLDFDPAMFGLKADHGALTSKSASRGKGQRGRGNSRGNNNNRGRGQARGNTHSNNAAASASTSSNSQPLGQRQAGNPEQQGQQQEGGPSKRPRTAGYHDSRQPKTFFKQSMMQDPWEHLS